MIFVLKGADFSGSNIGQTPIPAPVQSEMYTLLSHMTKYTINNPISQAVNTAIYELKRNNIWDKINVFCVPCMAANIGEVFYDLKRNRMMNPQEGVFLLNSNGRGVYHPMFRTGSNKNYVSLMGTLTNNHPSFQVMVHKQNDLSSLVDNTLALAYFPNNDFPTNMVRTSACQISNHLDVNNCITTGYRTGRYSNVSILSDFNGTAANCLSYMYNANTGLTERPTFSLTGTETSPVIVSAQPIFYLGNLVWNASNPSNSSNTSVIIFGKLSLSYEEVTLMGDLMKNIYNVLP